MNQNTGIDIWTDSAEKQAFLAEFYFYLLFSEFYTIS